MSNNIEALRKHLFDTLEALKDKSNPMDLDRAKTISGVAQTIINAAKVEVDYVRATGSSSAFLETTDEDQGPALPDGITGRTIHRIRG